MTKRIIGAVDLLIGLAILFWVCYCYFVEMQPYVNAFNSVVALIFACSAIYTGAVWVKGK